MGIDRIGNKGPPTPPPSGEIGGIASSPARTERTFQVPGATASAPAVAATRPVAALDRLRAGEIDLDGYLDLKVDEATGHLASLPPVELAGIRGALRDRLASDPTLVDLVRTATGQAPKPPHDD